MNFEAISGNRRSRRYASVGHAPAMIETLETRALLAGAGPVILSPAGTIATAQPVITWQPTPGATSYDLWISDSETRERIVFKEGIPGTTTTLGGGDALRLGANRIWVRATVNGAKTDWGVPKDVLLQSRPVTTGPINSANPAAPNRIETNDWAVTWTSPDGATSFDVFLSNQTEQTSTRYTVKNQVPLLNARGNAILDGAGKPILQEVRSLYIDGAVDVVGAKPQAVTGAVNRTFIDITANKHGLVTGNKVRVSGVLGNTGANGDFTVTVISENVFRLDNAVSSGTYTSGGNWIPLVGNAPAAGVTSRLVLGLTASRAIDINVANHGLKTGEKVRIAGVGGNNAANGTFTVTVVSASVLRLTGVAGTATFTQNGQLVQLTSLQSKLELGKYRVFVRNTDDGGRVSDWSTARDFEITPVVNVLRPQGPTFETQPLLQWAPVSGATHYQVEVYGSDVRVASVGHGLKNGDSVRVFGVRGLAGANGDFAITVISADVFRLRGAVGSGVYTTGGSWQKLSNGIAGPKKNLTGVTLQKDATIPVYNIEYQVGTSFRIPYEISRSVPVVSVQGKPTTGTYSLVFEVFGETVVRKQTAPLAYNATAAQIKAAINAIGLQSFDVIVDTTAASFTYRIQTPADFDAVKTSVVASVNPGTIVVTATKVPIPVQQFDFRVRARRLHQVTTITPSGSPASGTFIIELTPTGKNPVRVQTAALNYNSTANQIQAAVRILKGFENARVIAQGEAPNTVFLLQLPLTGNEANPGAIGGNPVTVNIISSVTPGTVTSSTVISPRVDGQWSPLVSFTTIQKPVITGPLGIDNADPNAPRTITDLRPTLQWTPIDKSARYEIWVERSASTSTYLRTNSSVNSYKFQADLLSGNYTVRVRAVSTTGQFTDWSDLFAFTATGGASVVQSVAVSPTRRATITWAPVAEAATYEVQIAWIGTNIDYLHPTGITVLSYTTSSALSPGNYRVWVRAVKADGTFLGWSKPFDFTVVATELLTPSQDDAEMLAVLKSELSSEKITPAAAASEVIADQPDRSESYADSEAVQPSQTFAVVIPESVQAPSQNSLEQEDSVLIEQLAQACTQQEWWTVVGNASV
jgi:hypothetical protein